MSNYFWAFAIAFGITYLITPAVKRFAIKSGAIDKPDGRKVHQGLIPRLGGLAIYLGYIGALLSSVSMTSEVIGLLIGSTVLVGVGMWDDMKQIGPKTKLCGQIVAAMILVLSGVSIDWITSPSGKLIYFEGWFAFPFTVFWIVAFTNMVNLIDGLDGLAAGISLIACVTIFFVTLQMGQVETALITVSLAGSIFAFLRYNFNQAKIFMGDTGSMLLGYTLAAISVIGVVKMATTVALAVPVIVLGLPIMDTAFAIIRRYMNGQPIFKPDKGHLHHRLLAIGLTHKQAVLLMYGMTAFLGCVALVVAKVNLIWGIILIVTLLIVGVYLALRLGVIGKNAVTRDQMR